MFTRIRLLFFVALLGLGAQSAFAQIKIGDNPGNLDANAVLEIESTNKGFLLPRLTTAQRTGMVGVTQGMTVYDTDAKCTYVYRGITGWYSLCAADSLSTSNGISLVGRDVQLGGTLTKTTTIGTNGTNTLKITGDGTNNPLTVTNLQGGDQNDSIVTVTASTGVVRKRAVADVLKASNVDTLVWKIDGNTVDRLRTIGTKNAFDFPIITSNVERMKVTAGGLITIGVAVADVNSTVTIAPNGGATNPITLKGLKGGASTDSILTSNGTGVVRQRAISDVLGTGLTADNGLNKSSATNVQLGGTLLKNTAVDQSGFSLTLANGATNINATGTGATNIGNSGSNVTVAGTTSVTGATTINTTGSTTTSIGNASSATTVLGTTNVNTTGTSATFIGNSSGLVAIGTGAAPKSTLDLTGSFAVPIATKTGAYTVTLNDHTVIADCTSVGITLTLPDPATCTGRTYILIKGDNSGNVLTFGSFPVYLATATSITSVNYNVRLHIQSDGSKWWLIARF